MNQSNFLHHGVYVCLFNAFQEANTQDDVGYDPYSDWFNNAPDANLQDNLNTADESLVARQRQNVNGLNWGKAEEQDDDKASDSDEWDFGEVKQQGDGENTDSKPSEDVDDIMIQFFNHPGDPKVQKEVHWNDRDFLKVICNIILLNDFLCSIFQFFVLAGRSRKGKETRSVPG